MSYQEIFVDHDLNTWIREKELIDELCRKCKTCRIWGSGSCAEVEFAKLPDVGSSRRSKFVVPTIAIAIYTKMHKNLSRSSHLFSCLSLWTPTFRLAHLARCRPCTYRSFIGQILFQVTSFSAQNLVKTCSQIQWNLAYKNIHLKLAFHATR